MTAGVAFPGKNGRTASDRTTGEGVDDPTGDFEIFTMNPEGMVGRRGFRGPATVFETPGWSPGGEEIVFTSNQDGPDEIHKTRRDGSAQKRLKDNGAPRDAGPVFSPDDQCMAFDTDRDGNGEIYKMRPDGTRQRNLTKNSAADFAPDRQPLKERR